MPIEFRCQQCQKLLRTGDETAGKQAKCPACGSVQTIPIPGAAPQAAGYNLEANPYAGQLAPPVGPSNPFAVSDNPYQSPSAAPPIRALGHQDPARTFQPTIIEAGDVLSRTWIILKANMTMTVVA